MRATTPDSPFAKPFLTVPEQIRRLRGRGMDCGDDAYATEVLERYGYYRLSGYWHLYRNRPASSAPRFDEEGREIRLERQSLSTPRPLMALGSGSQPPPHSEQVR